MNRPTNQSNSDAKEKVARLKGLLDEHDGGKGIGLSKIINIFRKDYIKPIFSYPHWNELDSETAYLAAKIVETLTSNAKTVMAGGISSIGRMMVSGEIEGEYRLPEDICPGLGFLLEELGCLLTEVNRIDYDITIAIAERLGSELLKQEQLVEVSALKD